MLSAISNLLAFLADPSCEWTVVPLAEFHARLTAVCLSAIFMAFVVCVVCAVSNRRKLKHMAALLVFALGMTIAAQKDLTNGTDGVSAPMPPMMQTGPRFGHPSNSVTNDFRVLAYSTTPTSTVANVGLPPLVSLPDGVLDVFACDDPASGFWCRAFTFVIPSAATNVVLELPHDSSAPMRIYRPVIRADADDDEVSDIVEAGCADVLKGENFLWFDRPGGHNSIAQTAPYSSYWWGHQLPDGYSIRGARFVQVMTHLDGFTHVVSATNTITSFRARTLPGVDFRTTNLSPGNIVIAAMNADCYADAAGWGSGYYSAVVTTNGASYRVIEYENFGLTAYAGADSPLATYEIILPLEEPGIFYVSYLDVDPEFAELGMPLGVQWSGIRPPADTNGWYTLQPSAPFALPASRTTIRYTFGTLTDPDDPDTDGDGTPDGSDPLPRDATLGSYGQDETWVRMNFTNSEEILSVGYANWVDAQVGVGLTNGLYKFTATFPSAPAEPTRLTVGGVPVLVNAAGDYVFLLEKGTEYSFDTDPFAADVTYAQADDLVASPVVPDTTQVPRQWTVGGGEVSLVEPTATAPGSTLMMPVLLVAPDVTQAGWHSFPMTFSAFLSDCRDASGASFLWTPGNDSVEIASPHSPSTSVYGQMAYDETFLSVSTTVGGRTLTAYLPGDHRDEPEAEVTLGVSCPSAVFLNDDHRAERVYVLTVTASCPVPTNGVISVVHSGATGVSFFTDGAMTSTRELLSESLAYSGGDVVYTAYFTCANIASGTFTVTMSLPNGDTRTATADYSVIEPIRKLVTNELDPQTRAIVNPCCLIFGREASLLVGVNGSFSPDDVAWSVVSGPGRIVSSSGFSAKVEPTQESGTVVVEARFNDDAVQPTFVLPIVRPQTVPIRAFVVYSDDNEPAISDEDIAEQLRYADRAFAQVGISFNLVGIEHHVADSSYWNVAVNEPWIDPWGVKRKKISDQAVNLLNWYHERDCIEVYYVGMLSGSDDVVAAGGLSGIIMGQMAQPPTLAHELGHVFGLKDIYDGYIDSHGRHVQSQDMEPNICGDDFIEKPADWNLETGYGFYGSGDTRIRIVRKLLMYGFLSSGLDVPAGSVRGVPTATPPLASLTHIPVGKASIITNALEGH